MEKELKNCNKCLGMVKNFVGPDFLSGKNRILIVGESPKGKLADSFSSLTFKKLMEELEQININLLECNLTEICKCELINRKYLKVVGKNCINNLDTMIKKLKPNLIISIGVISKEIIEDYYDKNFEIGNLGIIYDSRYLPLYHPSPANPKGHKNNLKILKIIDTKMLK